MQILRHRSRSKAARDVLKVGVALLFALTGAVSSANSVPTLAYDGAAAASTAAQFTVDGFEEAVVATAATTAEEDAAIRLAALHFSPATLEGLASFDTFLASYPNSGWRLSILTNLGLSYYREGYFSRAIANWGRAWTVGKSVTSPSPRARALIDRAIGELIRMHARLGHKAELEVLMGEVGKRPLTGPATEAVAGAKQGLWKMQTEPGVAFLCGPKALMNLALLLDSPESKRIKTLDGYRAGTQGVSLAELTKLVSELQLPYRAAFRASAAPIPVPSLIHWKVNHYAAIVAERDGRYHIKDPTFGVDLWLSRAALESEGSGFFLIPANASREGWRDVTVAEAAGVHGMGMTTESDPAATKPTDVKTKPTCSNAGMCGYNFHEMLVSLNITDRPLGYKPALGPSVLFELTYNQREARQPAVPSFFNFGPKWTSNWLTYIVDDPRLPGANVMRYAAGGGAYDEYGYNSSSGKFTPERADYSTLIKIAESPARYERRMQDGSKEIYAQSDGATSYPRRIFLSAMLDKMGNAVNLAYDGRLRLVTITDAVGQVTILKYKSELFPLQVTEVMDPFERKATMQYDAAGRLKSIKDVIGLVSTISYDAGDFVTSLRTPYGTTRFSYGENGMNRWLQATDVLGYTERLEFRHDAPGVDSGDTRGAPVGMQSSNASLNYRNTFYWDQRVYASGTLEYTKARIRHWYHDSNLSGTTSGVLQSSKESLEGRVWFNTPGDTEYTSGAYEKPSRVGRILDDGTSQVTLTTYNSLGNVESTTDPVGRTTKFVYAANEIDIVQVLQLRSGVPEENIASFTYNSQHLPLTYVDAAGQLTSYTYDERGRLLSETNPLGQTTNYMYDRISGRLTEVLGPTGIRLLGLKYDHIGRVAERTDSEGYTVSYTYDALDRVTRESFPGVGFDNLYGYTNLSLTGAGDRLGRVYQYTYDHNGRLRASIDAGLHIGFDYYPNGLLKNLIDPKGGVTTWLRDPQGRVIAKKYPGGKQEKYEWEAFGGRLKSTTGPSGKTKSFSYTVDDRIAGMSYSGGDITTPSVRLSYDSLYPRLKSMVDGNGMTSYDYGKIGTLGALQLIGDNGPFSNDEIAYEYDAVGRVVARAVAGAREQWIPDQLGRVSKNINALGQVDVSYLGATSQVTNKSIGGAVGYIAQYEVNDKDRRLKSITGLGGAGKYSYDSDVMGNFKSIIDNPIEIPPVLRGAKFRVQSRRIDTSRTWKYEYDSVDRLTSAMVSDTLFSYKYDYSGNRLEWQTPTTGSNSATYNSSNQIVSSTLGDVQYDADGNVTADANRTYRWDADNRLVQIGYKAWPNMKTKMSYDGFGRRVAIIESSGGSPVENRYSWCGEVICLERDRWDVITKRYFEDGVYVASNNTRFFYNKDHLGSVRDVMNIDSKAVSASFDYDPYGNLYARDVGGLVIPVDFRYAGMFYHTVSGLYLTHYRAYDPSWGRWLSRDPIGEEGGINLYAYVGGNPLSFVDPLGLETCLLTMVGPGGIRDHAAIFTSRGDGAGGPAIYDPAGAYSTANQAGSGDVVMGPAANIGKYRKFHSGEKVESTCKDTAQVEEESIIDKALSLPSAAPFQCSSRTSTALSGQPSFPNVQPGTFWPGNLLRQVRSGP